MSYIGQAPNIIISENTFDEFNFTATSNQTTFTGADSDGKTLVYNPNNSEVFLNGVRLEEADFTATDGSSIVLASGATTGDLMSVKSFKIFEVGDAVSKASGGAFGGNVSVTGTVTATSFSGDGSSLSGISTDLVADITPQLGGNLDTNGKNIAFGDSSGSTNNRLTFGSNNEFQIYQNPSLGTYMVENGSGKSMRFMASDFKLQNTAGTHEYIVMTDNGSVAISHGNGKKFETTTTGVTVTGTLTASGTGVIGSSTADTTISGGTPALQVIGSGFNGYMAAVRRDTSQYASGIALVKSRNTSVGSYTALQDNDGIGGILFIGDDGTDLDTYGATITAVVNGTPSNNNMPADLEFATNSGTSSPTLNMKLTKDGVLEGASDAEIKTSPIRKHSNTISTNTTVASTENAVSGGPITIANGVTVTVSGDWTVV